MSDVHDTTGPGWVKVAPGVHRYRTPLRCRLLGHKFPMRPVIQNGWYLINMEEGGGPCVTANWKCLRCGGLRHYTRWLDGSGPTPSQPGVPSI